MDTLCQSCREFIIRLISMLSPERLLLLTTVCEALQLEGSVSRPDYASTEKETVAMDIEWTSKIQTQLGHQPRHTEGNQKTDAHAGVQGRFREHKGWRELQALPYSS